jgi:pimeloyl-ACP methyl ester carboxylesterase
MYLKIGKNQIFAYTGSRPLKSYLPSIIFVHGTGMDHTVWLLPARFFAHHEFNVLAIDLPGHGRSNSPAATSIEQMSDEVIAVMDVANVEHAALVGHSMGSLVALSIAARHPNRVRSLTLIGTAVPMSVHKSLLTSAAQNDHSAIDMLTYWGYSKAAQLGGNENPGMWMVGSTMRLLEQSKKGVIHSDLNACHHYTAGALHTTQVQCATLFILGKKDIMTPASVGQEMSNIISNSKILLLDGAGHSLMMERPNDILDGLIDIV